MKKLLKMHRQGKVRDGALIVVHHDNNCAIYHNDVCDCDPEIEIS